MAKIIGIDLASSDSAAAVMMGGRPTMIRSAEGTNVVGKAFPSYVVSTKEGTLLVGELACRQAISHPEGTIMAIKQSIGTDHKVTVYGKEFTPKQVSAFILQEVNEDAEGFLGEQVAKAVIKVPAYFNDKQRQATKDAGAMVDVEVARMIDGAKDLATGKQTSITITASTKLNEKDKERMVKEAEQFADADKKKKEEAETRNSADSLLYTVEKTKSDLKDKIPAELLAKLDNASKELKDAPCGKDIDTTIERTELLTTMLKEIRTVAYQQTSASQASSSGRSDRTDPTGQRVMDAEYKVDQDQNQQGS